MIRLWILVILALLLTPLDGRADTAIIRDGQSGKDKARFTVEIARTAEETERGLMFRREMAQNSGMAFLFDPPRPVAMWMKNTYVPLDILFADASGRIIHIERDMIPLNLTPRGPAVGDVAVALEVPAGSVPRFGIMVQDRLAIFSVRQ